MMHATVARGGVLLLLASVAWAGTAPAQNASTVPRCVRPDTSGLKPFHVPQLRGLFPLTAILHPYRFVVVREFRDYRPRTLDGDLLLSAAWSRRSEERRLLPFRGLSPTTIVYRAPGGLNLDVSSMSYLDSIPRASFDSTFLRATATLDSTDRTMLVEVGDPGNIQLTFIVFSTVHGLSGLWYGRSPNDPDSPRGYFCAVDY